MTKPGCVNNRMGKKPDNYQFNLTGDLITHSGLNVDHLFYRHDADGRSATRC